MAAPRSNELFVCPSRRRRRRHFRLVGAAQRSDNFLWPQVTIFQECQPEFLHDLVLKMKAFIFTPGDLICRKGEVAREMFIIADGILEVIR